jgi:large subunit ribosomal protein L6
MAQFITYSIVYPKDILIKIFFNKTKGLYTLILFGFSKQVQIELQNIFIISQDTLNRKLIFTLNKDFSDLKKLYLLWRSYQVIITNLVNDFIFGYEILLELRGVGFKAFVDNNNLLLSLGFSHPILFKIPESLQIRIVDTKNILFSIRGFDRNKVNEIASKIRSYKKPEPYKGKGVCYYNEIVTIKESKKEQ